MTNINNLESEIKKLRIELNVSIPEEIQEALESGDARENSEIYSILDRQHIITIRLSQLLNRLSRYKEIDISDIPRDVVGVGSLVHVECVNTYTKKTFKIVSSDISDIFQDDFEEVTVNSPLGKSLCNKAVNEIVTVKTPNNKILYKIIDLTTIHDL
jgi:transcription elongation GreA/GreB family factor